MKRIILFACALMVSLASFAQQYDTDFTQVRRLKASGKTTNMKGHLTFDGKERLNMDYSEPAGEFFIIDGNMVKMDLMGVKAEMDAEKVPMVKLQRATLLTCLTGGGVMNEIFNTLNGMHVAVQSINTRATKDGRTLVNLSVAANSVEHL